jgi:hypothetical protein
MEQFIASEPWNRNNAAAKNIDDFSICAAMNWMDSCSHEKVKAKLGR